VFNTIDYVVEGFKKAVFQTCEKERGKVVFQMVKFLSLIMNGDFKLLLTSAKFKKKGTCDPERALKVCKLV
jgi:hypothetical protein